MFLKSRQKKLLLLTNLLILVTFILLYSVGPVASAETPEQLDQSISLAYEWIEQNPGTYWGINYPSDIRDISELAVLLKNNATVTDLVYQAENWLRSLNAGNNDITARTLPFINDQQQRQARLISLIDGQNPDGGWGLTEEYGSDVLDTILVARALLGEPGVDAAIIKKSVAYLLQSQNSDGSWSFIKGQPGNIYLTAETALLLNSFTISTGLNSEQLATGLRKSGEYLVSQQNNDQTWGTCEETLQATLVAYRAVLNSIGIEPVETLEDTILGLQDEAGSWQNSLYTTILAVKALKEKQSLSSASIDGIRLFKYDNTGNKLEICTFKAFEMVVIEVVGQYNNEVAALQVMVKQPDGVIVSAESEEQFRLNTSNRPPGNYVVIALVKDKQTGKVLDSKEKVFSVDSSFEIKDIIVTTDPAAVRINDQADVKVMISLINQSNQEGQASLSMGVIGPDGTVAVSVYSTVTCRPEQQLIVLEPLTFTPDTGDVKDYTITAEAQFNGITVEKQSIFKVLPPPPPTRVDAVQTLNKSFLYPGSETVTATFTLAGQGIPEIPQRQPIDLVLVLDNSGSMWGNPSQKSREAAKTVVDLIQSGDRAAVVVFTSSAWIQQNLTENIQLVKNKIDQIQQASGGTAIGRGLQQAIAVLDSGSNSQRQKVIILLSDGYENTWSNAQVINQAPIAAQKSITVHTIGLGQVDENLLKTIAQIANGTYRYSPTPDQLQQMMLEIGGEIFDTAGTDVTFTTTLPPGPMPVSTGSIQPLPHTLMDNPDGSKTINWYFDRVIMGQTINIPLLFSGNELVSDTIVILTSGTELTYLDRNKTPVTVKLEALELAVNKYKVDTSITLDKQSYNPGESVRIAVYAQNLTDYVCVLSGIVDVTDTRGTVVGSVYAEDNITWVSGQTRDFSYSWNCENVIAGVYLARVRWLDGEKVVSGASAGFSINSDGGISNSVTTDRVSYRANETVSISETIGNDSRNTLVANLMVRTQILDNQENVIWNVDSPLNELAPSASVKLRHSWEVGQSPPGRYTVGSSVYQSGVPLSSKNTTFTIMTSEESGVGLMGDLDVQTKTIYPHEDVEMLCNIQNTGNTQIDHLQTRIRIVDPESQQVVDTISSHSSLAVGEHRSDSVTWTHEPLTPGRYMVVYDAVLNNGNTIPLSSGSFRVEKPFTVNPESPLTITTTSLPNGTVGTPYSATLAAGGGTEPYTWSATGLPAGLSINTVTGEVYGTPTAEGNSFVVATVYDSAGQRIDSQPISLTINAASNGSGGDESGSESTPIKKEQIKINPEPLPLALPLAPPLGLIKYYDPYVYGYPDNTFRPGRAVTRAEMATMFSRILKLDIDNPGSQIYTDISSGHWAYRHVQAASKLGLFRGYPDGTFKPDQPISRAEIAALFSNYWNHEGVKVATTDAPFTDISQHWAQTFINKLYNAGGTSGFPDNTFRPDKDIVREQIVVMINKLIARPQLHPEAPLFTDVFVNHWAYGDIEAAARHQAVKETESGE